MVHFKIQHWYKSPRKKEPQSNLSKEKKLKRKGEKTSDGENGTCAFFFFFLFTSAYFNKENKHEQRCEVVVIRSAGLVVPNSWVLKCQSLSRWSTLTPWRHVYYYILLLCGCSEIGPSPCPLSVMRKTVQKSSPQWALSVRGRPSLFLSPCVSLSGFFFHSFVLAAWLKSLRDAVLVRARITWRTAWCPGRRPVGGGSMSRCSASASPRTSWRWRRRRTPFGRTCSGTGNGSGEYLREKVLE